MNTKILLAALNVMLAMMLIFSVKVASRWRHAAEGFESANQKNEESVERAIACAEKAVKDFEDATEELRRCRIEAFRLSQSILTNAPQ